MDRAIVKMPAGRWWVCQMNSKSARY
jgi:hypothetical protein